jgi:hypothetical protein
MKSAKILAVAALFVLPMLTAKIAFTQTQEDSFQTREQNFREYVTLLRGNIKAERRGIIKQLMQFDADDAAKFWPTFDQYDAELNKFGDGRAELIVEYARNYENLTDEQADKLMSKAFELEAQRAMLKKKYFDIMKTSIGAVQAAKFFLIENQMQHIVDLQISAELPVVQTASK